MIKEHGVLVLILSLAFIFTLSFIVPQTLTAVGPGTAWAQPEDEEPEEEEPVQARPNPMDDGEHGFVTLVDGRSAQMVGGRLLLLDGSRKVMAPDGTYRLQDGRSLTVRGGKLMQAGDDAQSGRPELPAVQSGRPEMPGSKVKVDEQDYDREGGARMQSGRPETPGSKVKVNDHDWDRQGGSQMQSGRPEMPGAGIKWDPTDKGWDPGDRITLKDGRSAVMDRGAGGKMQMFLLQGNSRVLAPDGTYQLQNGQSVQVQGGNLSGQMQAPSAGQMQAPSAGQMQAPGQMQMPGKLQR